MESLHDVVARDGRLEVADTVFFLDINEFLAHDFEILQEILFALLVLARDVGLAKEHQVVDVVASLEEQAAHRAVGHLVVGNGNGAHVQPHELLDVLHALVERQLQPLEQRGYHLFAQIVMVVERPAHGSVPLLAARLADVVQKRRPAQIKVVALGRHVVEHFERVVEVILMRPPVACFYAVEGCQFGQDYGKQSAAMQFDEAVRGRGSLHYLIKFHDDTLRADDAQPLGVAPKRVESFFFDYEAQLRGEADAAHHAQGVVAEGDVGVERRADNSVFKVEHAFKGVYQFAEPRGIEADGHGVDCKVAAVLVVLQRAVFNDWLAGIVGITFAARPYKFHFVAVPFHLRRAEIGKHADRRLAFEPRRECLCHCNAAAHDNNVDVVGGALEEKVAHVAAHEVALHSQVVGGGRKGVEQRAVDLLPYFFCGKDFHYLSDIMAQGDEGVIQQHSRAAPAHHAAHLLAHISAVAMHGTTLAGRLFLAEAAAGKPLPRVRQQVFALGREGTGMEFLAAIEPYHDFNNLLLLFYACHRARHFNYI